MQALRWHAAEDVRLDEVEEPGDPGEGFALVDVAYCGICGSDLAEFRDGPCLISPDAHPLSGQAPPITLGHEFSGTVSEAHPGSRFERGTRVTADACWRCGDCDECLRGNYNWCRYGGSIGLHSDGAFAAMVRVPEYALVELTDGVTDQIGALAEPLAVGLHALERPSARPGDDVVVLGFGPIGAASAICARALGAKAIVVEPNQERLARAESMGFDTLAAGERLPRRVRAALGAGGGSIVIDSTGVAAIVSDAIECARRGGRIVLVGLSSSQSSLDGRRLTLFERSLIGSLGYRHDLPKVIKMLETGQIDASGFVGDVVPLVDAGATLSDLASRPDGRIKVLVSVRG
jgi:(R,R)-butanediol dehydrogenase / meso-butanediol dehydrogenase / diacetyl reductase